MFTITITPFVAKTAALAPTFSLITFKTGGHADQAIELDVPWHPLQANPSLFALLSWHTRASEFKGRDEQMAALKRWANDARAVSIRFVTGAGGVGKSRLAAEFASELQKDGWAAGFVDLKEPKSYESHSKNILIVIDYPEENQEDTRELLRKLAPLRHEGRLRVLFLTRQEMSTWQNVIRDSRVETLVEMKPVHLSGIDAAAALEIYLSASQTAGEVFTSEWLGVDEEMISAWLKEAPENELPLFILAAGVHNATKPGMETIEYKGRDIVESLVERELTRFRNIARDCNVKDGILFARLLSIATIAGVIPENKISEVMERLEPYSELPAHFDPQCELQKAGLLNQGEIRALAPDIVAAAFITRVLRLKMDIAPELAWIGLNMDVQGGLLRLGRLSYDAEVVLGNHRFRLSNWLAEGIEGHIDRAQVFISSFNDVPPIGLLNAAIVACMTILPKAENEIERAGIYNNLCLCLSNSGQRREALEAAKRAVEIYERLAAANPQAFESDLAMSLNNLGSLYSGLGQRREALEAAKRAVEICERLAAANPQAFERHLAGSLTNLGNRYSVLGQGQEALEAAKRAVEICERLAAANPQAFEPDLAMSLNNMGNRYSVLGQGQEALEAAKRAVEIRERLAAANPQAFESDLASSLINLGSLYFELGQQREALEAAKRAVEI
ncbi:MAG: ATP-binding protein, partial [Deltaproteobacteria bacterium]|nr:ATP-binding protein [Deltaproteobacteria bacterium]